MNAKIDICFFIYNDKSDKCLGIAPVLDYPKDLLNITVYSDREISHQYKHVIMPEKDALLDAQENSSGNFVWLLNADYIIQSTSALRDLLETKLNVCSGLQTQAASLFSNFWGAISESGWYLRSEDYEDIRERKTVGHFDVPYVTGNILIKTDVFKKVKNLVEEHEDWDLDMNLCHNLRKSGEKLFIVNNEVYGYIEETNIALQYSDLGPWKDFSYLDPKFLAFMDDFKKNHRNVKTDIFKELGPDIWQFPIFKPEFCDYLIELAEQKGDWSAGIYAKKTEVDPRLGAVENYPTQDIHLNQMGLHDWWLEKIVGECFKNVMSHLYKFPTRGYNISFIVKYTPEGQAKLDPHHDASAYTTNIALNTYGEDYTGGGCNFLHKKIECIGNLKGHVIMHPGRITHYHEAYPVKSGKRYILVSFNN